MADADELFARGAEARRAGRNDLAEPLFREALAREPTHRDARVALAFLLREEGEGGEAAEVLRPLVAAPSAGARDLVALAEFAAETGALDLALEAFRRAREVSGEAPAVLAAHGRLLLQAGRFEDARAAFRQAFERDPGDGGAFYQWVQTRRWRGPEGEEALEVLGGAVAKSPPAPARAAILFARAKVLDDLGRTAEAFASLREANAIRKGGLPPFDHSFYEEWLETFPRGAIPSRPAFLPAAEGGPPAPLFVVGLPRSGTTLLARLLLRRGDAGLAGELDLLGRLATHLAGPGARPRHLRQALGTLGPSDRNRLAGAYRRELRARLGGRRLPWAIDKNPLNLWHLPLLRVLFPRAPVLWCRRDRRDVLLSLYFQNFAHPALDFSYDFDDLERHLAAAARAEETLLPAGDPFFLVVEYEELVQDPGTLLSRLENLLGPSRPTAGEGERSAGGRIATASAWQARQPVHTESVGRWRRYAPFLLEARPALRGLGIVSERSAGDAG